jgi:glycerol-1-phosphatase
MTALPGTTQPLAAVHDVALLDLDGVVYVGPHAVPHAAEALHETREAYGLRSCFVTNNAARAPAEVAEHLRALGVHADAADVVTSAQAGARVLVERIPAGSPVLAVGGPGVAWALDERGLVPVTSADAAPVALMTGFGPDVGWRQLAEATLAIDAGAFWVATNLDRTIPTPRGRVLGNGSLVAALRHATGAEPVAAGKPEPPLMQESVQRTGAKRPLVVGDRLDTDIEGAVRSGIPSLLVLTGVTGWRELVEAPVGLRPDYVGHDLRSLLVPATEATVTIGDGALFARCGAARIALPVRPAVSGATARGSGSDWLPEDSTHSADTDLEVVRCLIALGWTLVDERLQAAGRADVSAG